MSETIAPPPEKPTARRRALPWLSPKPETRAMQIGVLATVLLHLLMYLGLRHSFWMHPTPNRSHPHVAPPLRHPDRPE